MAAELMSLPKAERLANNVRLHEELYRRVPDHPLLTTKRSSAARAVLVAREKQLLLTWLKPGDVFLELGAGDCAVSFAIAGIASKVYGLDLHDKIARDNQPANFELVISDGVSVPASGVNLAYSNQLIEHIHPEDALEQLANTHAALAPGGVYVCNTPNRLTGPHDISRHFDKVATGFHLHEYTIRELAGIFRKRFRRVTWVVKSGLELPTWVGVLYECVISAVPKRLRKRLPLPTQVAGYR
ncbi:MAG: class I SAM-dependent methyltransferase [Steroidobacteraceae bacterium]